MKLKLTWVIASLLGVTACGTQSTSGGPGAAAIPEISINPTPVLSPVPEQLQTNWDAPVLAPIETTLTDAAAAGSLGFQAVVPEFGVPPTHVQVSDPLAVPPEGRSLSLLYRFPRGADFPTDGRVLVREQPAAEVTVDVLNNVAKGNAASGQYSMTSIGERPALLISAHGIGRVTMLSRGLTVDVTGPAVSLEEAIKLAQDIG